MKTILTRLFTVAVLMMASMTAGAQVKVLYGEKGEDKFKSDGGTIEVKQEVSKKDATKTTVYLIVTPGKDYKMAKDGVEAYATIPTDISTTRALEVSEKLTLTCEDFKDEYSARTYYADIDSKLALWVKSADFQKKGDSGAKYLTPSGPDYSGTYYIGFAGLKAKNYDPNNQGNNYYMCPTENWCWYQATDDFIDDQDNGQPFLTTHKIESGTEANYKWIVKKHTKNGKDYYSFRYGVDHGGISRYLLFSGQIRTAGENRVRVHIEKVTYNDTPDDNALFEITTNKNGGYKIRPINIVGYWINVTNGNYDNFVGNSGKTGGPSGHGDVAGTIGIWNEENQESRCYFEDVITRPTITINPSNEIVITAAQSGDDVVIKYTTDGSDPVSNGTEYTVPINPSVGTTIRAVAIVSGVASNVATFQRRLIQSQNNGWTIDESTTDFHFYLTQGGDANDITKVNTTSLFRPSMEWYIIDNKNCFNYIVNASNRMYLCYDGTNNVYMAAYNNANDSKYKFSITESPIAGTFNIFSDGQNRLIDKENSNTNANVIRAVEYTENNANSGNARWKFVLPSDLDKDAPFTASNPSTNSYSYFKIASVGSNGYYIVPPSGNATDVTTSNSSVAAVVNTMNWYFEVAQAASSGDWLTYYHIRNAVTGNYLYFTKDANDTGACLEMRSTIDPNNPDRYMFTWAKTADTNANYYIVPKKLKDASLNQFSALLRDGGTLKTKLTRGASNYAWTFSPSSFTCAVPEVTYDEENDQIEFTSPNGADVYYNVNVDSEISSSNVTKYTVPIANNSSTQVIKAVCARNGTLSDKSAVVTVILNPTITLSEGASITYNGQVHQPTITSAIIGETTIDESEYELAGYIDGSGETVTGCKDAGVYTILITNQDGGDYFVYGSTSFTIIPATLTVTADAKEKDYLDPVPELTFNTTGLQGTDELADVLSGELACVVESDVVGNTYPITQGSLNSVNNYTISYTGANLTITPKSIGSGITPAAGITIDDITKTGSSFSTPTIKHNETQLELGTDYENPVTTTGNATTKYYNVTFTGRGNYTGSVTARYANVNFGTKDDIDYSATFVTNSSGDCDFAKPAGITPYIITGVDGTTLTAVELDYIPENVPVLLMASSSATNGFSVKVRSGGEDAATDANKLAVAAADHTFETGEIYILYNGEFVLNASGTLAAGKVYLPKSAIAGSTPAPARLLVREKGVLSSIKDADFSPPTTTHSNWYTLDGRRLSGKPTRKGLYLQNGQKVVIK